jgi:hypothetical protein
MARLSARKKRWLLFGGALALLLVILSAFLLLLPRFLNTEALKQRMIAAFSQALGGEISFKRMGLSFLPRPHLTLHDVDFSIPPFQGEIDALVIYPKLIPLLHQEVELRSLEMDRPSVRWNFAGQPDEKEDTAGLAAAFWAINERQFQSLIDRLSSSAPGLSLTVTNGVLHISHPGQQVTFRQVSGGAVFPPGALSIDITATSNLAERFSVKGSIRADTLTGRADMEILQGQPQILWSHLSRRLPLRIESGLMNLSLHLEMKGFDAVEGEFRGTVPPITLVGKTDRAGIKGRNFAGSFSRTPQTLTVVLAQLQLLTPQMQVSGRIQFGHPTTKVEAGLVVEDIDLGATRETLAVMGIKDRTVRTISEIVRNGQSRRIEVKSRGGSSGDLLNLQNLSIKGTVTNATIYVPDIDHEFTHVSGEASISNGILHAKRIHARHADTVGRQGAFTLGLMGEKKDPLRLDILIENSLRPLIPFLTRFAPNEPWTNELSLITQMDGRAAGRLILGETKKAIRPAVDISEIRLNARYERIPFPIAIAGGQPFFRTNQIRAKGLSGTIGASSFSNLSSSFTFDGSPRFDSAEAQLRLDLDQLYRWLAPWAKSAFGGIGSIGGAARLTVLDLKGTVHITIHRPGEVILRPEHTVQRRFVELSGESHMETVVLHFKR